MEATQSPLKEAANQLQNDSSEMTNVLGTMFFIKATLNFSDRIYSAVILQHHRNNKYIWI